MPPKYSAVDQDEDTDQVPYAMSKSMSFASYYQPIDDCETSEGEKEPGSEADLRQNREADTEEIVANNCSLPSIFTHPRNNVGQSKKESSVNSIMANEIAKAQANIPKYSSEEVRSFFLSLMIQIKLKSFGHEAVNGF